MFSVEGRVLPFPVGHLEPSIAIVDDVAAFAALLDNGGALVPSFEFWTITFVPGSDCSLIDPLGPFILTLA